MREEEVERRIQQRLEETVLVDLAEVERVVEAMEYLAQQTQVAVVVAQPVLPQDPVALADRVELLLNGDFNNGSLRRIGF
jgi:hypothetical protein